MINVGNQLPPRAHRRSDSDGVWDCREEFESHCCGLCYWDSVYFLISERRVVMDAATIAGFASFEYARFVFFGFKKGRLKVLAHSFDSNLGGRDFDEVLFKDFVGKLRDFDRSFGKEPRRTMNADEVCCRGCALQCAILNPHT
ncbi:hypothetical protein IFM89_029567 [Coptis chinensis]|uniref:Uncharacterized protein n=1 Tax=Coptis chinensis TaxID=261450 RepID=A0A835GYK3_9MAGN|nr:hypothetical protein IFM89_029567 [Coptis chinensis]